MQLELGSPADQAGIRQRDLILKIDGKDTNTVADLRSIIAEHKVGDNITITISRNGQVGDVYSYSKLKCQQIINHENINCSFR